MEMVIRRTAGDPMVRDAAGLFVAAVLLSLARQVLA